MRKIFIFSGLFFLINFLSFSQHESEHSGDWTTETTWANGNEPPTIIPNNHTQDRIIINAGNIVYLDEFLDINYNGTFILSVCGTLTLSGLEANNNFEILVCDGGTLIINGNVAVNNGLKISVEGSGRLEVNGNITLRNTANIEVNGTLKVDSLIGHQSQTNNLTGSGNIIANHVSGINTGGFSGVLPIELLSFLAVTNDQTIVIRWISATEINNDYFTIERSIDARSWEILGTVTGAGTTSQVQHYSYTDILPVEGLAYYRLKQTDFDGSFEYFGPVAAAFGVVASDFNLKVLKSRDHIQVVLPGGDTGQLEIYDITGKRLVSQFAKGTVALPMATGTYIIRFTNGLETAVAKVVM
jgi:hypothetical protein